MKISILGVGGVGGLLAARMTRAGIPVSLVARGATLEAIRKRGLKLLDAEGEWVGHPPVTDDPTTLGPQDVVFLCTKAHAIPAALPSLTSLLGPETAVVNCINGIPWWYFEGMAAPWSGRALQSVDPGGRIRDAIGGRRAIGAVVYVAVATPEPGVVRHDTRTHYILGEAVGGPSERCERIAGLIEDAGLKAPVDPDIRVAVWRKMWANVAMNPLSALARAACGPLVEDAATAALLRDVIRESADVATSLGIMAKPDLDKQMGAFREISAFRTSMLQDLDAGRRIELDPILGAVCEIGRMTGVPTPRSDLLYVLTKMSAEAVGCYAPPDQ